MVMCCSLGLLEPANPLLMLANQRGPGAAGDFGRLEPGSFRRLHPIGPAVTVLGPFAVTHRDGPNVCGGGFPFERGRPRPKPTLGRGRYGGAAIYYASCRAMVPSPFRTFKGRP
jgi:hypothetical protein